MIWVYLVELLLLGCCTVFQYMCPVDTGRKLNLHKTFRGCPWRLLNVWCTFRLRSVSTGCHFRFDYHDRVEKIISLLAFRIKTYSIEKLCEISINAFFGTFKAIWFPINLSTAFLLNLEQGNVSYGAIKFIFGFSLPFITLIIWGWEGISCLFIKILLSRNYLHLTPITWGLLV